MIAKFNFRKDIGRVEMGDDDVSTQPSSYRRRGDWIEICTLSVMANVGKEVKKYVLDMNKVSGKIRLEELLQGEEMPLDEVHEKDLEKDLRKELGGK